MRGRAIIIDLIAEVRSKMTYTDCKIFQRQIRVHKPKVTPFSDQWLSDEYLTYEGLWTPPKNHPKNKSLDQRVQRQAKSLRFSQDWNAFKFRLNLIFPLIQKLYFTGLFNASAEEFRECRISFLQEA